MNWQDYHIDPENIMKYWAVFKRNMLIRKLSMDDPNGSPIISNGEFAQMLTEAGLIPSPSWKHFSSIYYNFLLSVKRTHAIDYADFTSQRILDDDIDELDSTKWNTTYDEWILTHRVIKMIRDQEDEEKYIRDYITELNELSRRTLEMYFSRKAN